MPLYHDSPDCCFCEADDILDEPPTLTGHVFNAGDDATCRENFIQLEEIELSYDGSELEEFVRLYENILDAADEKGVALVDNNDFINWAASYGGFEDPDGGIPELIPILDSVAERLYSANGAVPITNVDLLDMALTLLFDQRVQF